MAKKPSWKPGGALPVVGDVLRIKSHHRFRKFDVYYVRAIVDEHYYVLCTWWPIKRRWHYSVESSTTFTHGEFSVDWEKEAASA